MESKWWFAGRDEIADDYNLSASLYRPIHHADIKYEDPIELINRVFVLEKKIQKELEALRKQLDQ